jgi:hypothetical protein
MSKQPGAVRIGCPLLALAATPMAYAVPVPVVVESTGDDGLTRRFVDAVTAAFRVSPDFTLDRRKDAPVLVFYNSGHLEWRSVVKRTRVVFRAEFKNESGGLLYTSTGACWEDDLAACAGYVLSDAKRAAARLQAE